jgi:multidrug resistance efflux pump
MDPLAPIPTPPAQRWREFRIQALPVITFLAVLACVVVLWRNYVLPTNMVGEVELVQAGVITAVPGTIKEVKVKRFQRVTAGEEIAVISTMDAETLQASLRAIEANMKLLRARMELDIERNRQSYEQTRLDYIKELTDLNFDRINAQYYELEANRLAQLATNNPVVSQTEYEVAMRLLASTRTNIFEKEKYLAEKEKTLPKLAPGTKADDAILEAIKGEEEALRATGQTISLKAPFDGMISAVNHFPGEKIVANAPIAVVSSVQATRIIGYVRKPYEAIPKPGDTIRIRRQSAKREVADGTVLEVSSHLSAISAMLVPIAAPATTNELGLAFAVSIPAQLALLPGEPVDLMFEKK